MSAARHCVVMTESDLYVWGENKSGQLGLGNRKRQSHPALLKPSPGRTTLQISTGASHTLLLLSDNTLQACGDNKFGQLGLGATRGAYHKTFQQVRLIKPTITQIASGCFHSLALTKEGTVYSWGSNSHGQLGRGSPLHQATPGQLLLIEKEMIQIDCGGYFSVGLTKKGILYAWGGENGTGGGVANQPYPDRVHGIEQVVQVSCGMDHVVAMTVDGNVYGWGGYKYGGGMYGRTRGVAMKIGLGPSPVAKVVCGGFHSMVLLRDGSLYSWGLNDDGQLGIGNEFTQNKPTKVEQAPNDIIEMKCGYSHSMLVAGDGFYLWGRVLHNTLYFDTPHKMDAIWKPEEKVYFEVCLGDMIDCWPRSHTSLSLSNQKVVEEVFLMMKFLSVPKDLSIQIIRFLLHII